eukprot:gene8447-2869_t
MHADPTAGYEEEYWYWETTILMRKAIMVFIAAYIKRPKLQAAL